jgi:hypothetical protein
MWLPGVDCCKPLTPNVFSSQQVRIHAEFQIRYLRIKLSAEKTPIIPSNIKTRNIPILHTRFEIAKTVAITLLVVASICPHVTAAIVVNSPTTNSTGTLVITEDIVYTITTSIDGGAPFGLILDEWTTSNTDLVTTYTDLQTPLVFMLNGSIVTSVTSTGLGDNVTSPNNDFTIHDGFFIVYTRPQMVIGDQLTLKAGSFVLSKTNSSQGVFNPQATQTFTGNTFITGSNAVRISNVVAVPEPGE